MKKLIPLSILLIALISTKAQGVFLVDTNTAKVSWDVVQNTTNYTISHYTLELTTPTGVVTKNYTNQVSDLLANLAPGIPVGTYTAKVKCTSTAGIDSLWSTNVTARFEIRPATPRIFKFEGTFIGTIQQITN